MYNKSYIPYKICDKFSDILELASHLIPNDNAINILREYPDIIDWYHLSRNSNDVAIEFQIK